VVYWFDSEGAEAQAFTLARSGQPSTTEYATKVRPHSETQTPNRGSRIQEIVGREPNAQEGDAYVTTDANGERSRA